MWHLYLAAIAGRDIYYDQRYAHNLDMRALLEAIRHAHQWIRACSRRFAATRSCLDQHRSVQQLDGAKVHPASDSRGAARCVNGRPPRRSGGCYPAGRVAGGACGPHGPLFFDAAFDPILTNKTPGDGRDILEASSNNLYSGVTMRALETFEEQYPLNSRLTARGRLIEDVYRVGGRYHREIGASSLT